MRLLRQLSSEYFITATDLKQYAFCPRIPYFQHVLGYNERVTESMLDGLGSEEAFREKEKRRRKLLKKIPAEEKVFNIRLCEPELGLMGKLDCAILSKHEAIPVEFKASKRPKKIGENHLNQLTAYAILLERHYGKIVRKGIIYYEKSDEAIEIEITQKRKRHVLKLLKELKTTLEQGLLPETNQPKTKCQNCGYKKICQP